jgi:hypothetical protein
MVFSAYIVPSCLDRIYLEICFKSAVINQDFAHLPQIRQMCLCALSYCTQLGCPRRCVFLTSDGIRNFLKNKRNSAEFRGIFCSKNARNSAEFRGIPSVFAYGIPHVSKWSRFQIPPCIKNKKFAQICEFKTRERKVSCRMYVMIFYNTENPRDKVN